MIALFIGRFQPFHNGHLKIIEKKSKQFDKIIIGIGSSQYSNEIENPFSNKEREEMIINSLEEKKITNYQIVFIPDIHDPPNWVNHILKIIDNFDVIISNNKLTIELFTEKGFKILKTPPYNKNKFSGERIRKKMICGEAWENLVPDPVTKIIHDINGVDRLKKISKR
jgi:nicotinamide-nucleotide adenylyltransferase